MRDVIKCLYAADWIILFIIALGFNENNANACVIMSLYIEHEEYVIYLKR